jgi:SAM-dependent methyltransferase
MSADPILRPADAEQILSEIRENLAATPPGSGPVYLYPIAPIDTNTAEEDYLASNPDVAAAIQRGEHKSALDHWLLCGMREGRRSLFSAPPSATEAGPSSKPLSGQRRAQGAADALSRLKISAANLQNQCSALDAPPPSPGTLRARVGGILVRLVRRMLWSHRRQWNFFADALQTYVREQAYVVKELSDAHLQFNATQDLLRRDLDDFRGDVGERQHTFASALTAQDRAGRQLGDELANITGRLESTEQAVDGALHQLREQLGDKLANIAGRLEHTEQAVSGALEQLLTLPANISRLTDEMGSMKARMVDALHSISYIRADLSIQTGRFSRALAGTPSNPPFSGPQPAIWNHDFDALYLAFEESFRGPREEIKKRQSVYLPFLRAAGTGDVSSPVFDFGCGRGEWLELLRENELVGLGVDQNQAMLDVCRSLNLPVTEADCLGYLDSLPDNSIGAVTAFHVLEHLPYSDVIGFLDQALRVLKPNGLLILETPNPSNILVGSCTFYLDPTHRNPLPSAMLRFFVEARGFTDCRILELCPDPALSQFPSGDDSPSKRLNEYLYGPRDYGVIAHKLSPN